MTYTHVVFVGHHKERLMESIAGFRKFPIHRVTLVIGDDDSTGERISKKVANSVRKDLARLFEVSIVRVDKRDIMKAASQVVDLVEKERESGYECILNMSGSLRTFAIAAYIAGCLTQCPMITSIPRYDDEDREVGVEEIIELPPVPVHFPKKDQAELLDAIAESSGYLEDLIVELSPEVKDMPDEFARERSRLAHHLKKIEEMGFVTREKIGKNVMFTLSPLGKIIRKVRGGMG
jgi:CRISPR-associated protein Csa3